EDGPTAQAGRPVAPRRRHAVTDNDDVKWHHRYPHRHLAQPRHDARLVCTRGGALAGLVRSLSTRPVGVVRRPRGGPGCTNLAPLLDMELRGQTTLSLQLASEARDSTFLPAGDAQVRRRVRRRLLVDDRGFGEVRAGGRDPGTSAQGRRYSGRDTEIGRASCRERVE